MRYGSVCSGIEAASVAWHPLGWEPQWFSEIEHFPSAVLKHRFPDVPNLGDMTQLNQNPIFNEQPIDLLVGGTPCQSFSVAGLRKGLADPRGNLMLTFLSIADKRRPKWIVWENVPGVLSSNGGKDFGTFLGALGELGYGFAYRVLDAQHFGVAQRRRRVFVVVYLGDWRPAAAVLFESESLQRNPKPSRAKRKETPTDVEGSVRATGFAGNVESQVAACLQTTCDDYSRADGFNTVIEQVAQPIAYSFDSLASNSMKSSNPHSGCREVETSKTIDTTTPEPSKNQGGIAIVQPISIAENTIGRQPMNGGNGDGFTENGPMYTLNATGIYGVAQPVHAFKVRGGCEGGGKGYLGEDEKAFTISAMQDQQVAQPISFDCYNQFITGDKVGIIREQHGTNMNAIAVDAYNYTTNEHTTQTIRSQCDTEHIGAVLQAMAIRRLTPKECERLQGFPDDWTKIPYRNKPADQCPDGPRYKACGNSMAVPVMRWIGTRIQMIENYLNP